MIEVNGVNSFSSYDGLKLAYRSIASSSEQPKGALIFIHGLNEHSGRYIHVMDKFKDEFECFSFDFRGHGHSEGKRSYVNSFEELVMDLASFVDLVVQKTKSKKVFLVGHSMGGQITLNYLATKMHPQICGFMTSSPNIRIAFKLHYLERKVGQFLSTYFPSTLLPNHISPNDLTHDQKEREAYAQDRLINKTVTARLGFALVKNQEDTLMDLASRIDLPALMMHSGSDRVCAKEGTIDFFNALPNTDKTLKIYDGAFHELFNEYLKDDVFNDMKKWLHAHL